MDDYHYVYHKETDEQAFRLQGGDLVEPDMMVEIPLTFQYEVLYNKDGIVNEKSHERFNKVIGDILMNVIDEGIEHDQIKINQQDRNDDSKQSSL